MQEQMNHKLYVLKNDCGREHLLQWGVKLSKSEKKLSGIIYERGVDEQNFAIIRSKGDQALFGGFTTADMKKKLGIPATRALADFLPTLTIKAKDFATELTSHNVVEKELKGCRQPAMTMAPACRWPSPPCPGSIRRMTAP